MSMVMEMDIIQDEISRINADTAQGEQSTMVQVDMKWWAVENGHWPDMDYIHMIAAHAVERGWTQEGFTGMEIVE